MHSVSRAQAGLEYLLTYGWALLLVVTIASLVVVRFMPPAEGVNFSAGGRQIIIKASNIGKCGGSDSGSLVLQNASGGKIKITSISGNGSFAGAGAGITVEGAQPPVTVAAGREIRLEKIDTACGAIGGTLNIEYTDNYGYQQTAEIRGLGNIRCCAGGGPPAQCAGSQQRDCPLQQGVCAGAKETCTNGEWPGCGAAAYGPLHEATETSCSDRMTMTVMAILTAMTPIVPKAPAVLASGQRLIVRTCRTMIAMAVLTAMTAIATRRNPVKCTALPTTRASR